MRIVIKIGGTLLDHRIDCAAIAGQLAETARRHQLIVVHGGGKQVTQFLEERGLRTHFVDGLRVSDEAVVDAVMKVIAGSVNKRLVSALLAEGEPALGLSGVDGLLTIAEPLDAALGFVGQPGRTDRRLLELLASAGFLPVIACIAADRHGTIYNVNADQMAVSCAIAWEAEKLVFLTDVAGVKDHAGLVLPYLLPDQTDNLIESGIAHGGMQAKLIAAAAALKAGIGEVIIAPGQHPDICRSVLAGDQIGTRVALHYIAETEVKA